MFPSRTRTGSGCIGQHEEAHTGVKMHSTSGENETAGTQKETAIRHEALTCSLMNSWIIFISHFLITFRIEEKEKQGYTVRGSESYLPCKVPYSIMYSPLSSQG